MPVLVSWFFIFLLLAGAGGYFWYRSEAGVTTNAPEASNTRVSTGLVSHWTFDREHISGTSITDRVGSNTGTSSGSPLAASGKFGQALDFDASDDHINVTSAASLDIDATEDFSIAGWFTRDTFASDHTIVAKRNGQTDTDDGYIVYIDDATDQLVFEVSDTSDADEYSVASTATFTAPGWHHFVVVWDQDSATGTKIYVDGAANGTNTGTIADIGDLTEAVAFRIGSESDGGARFDGKLDDIRFYSTILSANDVYQLYTAGTATVNASLDDPLSQSLRGYWKMDEGTGTSTTADSSGNANTLSMTGPPTWTTGTIGPSALDFSGSGQYLSVASPSSALDFPAGTNFTLTGWFNRDTFSANDHTVISNVAAQGSDGYIVWIDNDNSLYFRADDNADANYRQLVSAAKFAATGWHQFAVSWDDDLDANLYIDGALDASTKTGTFASVDDLTNANAFRIGAETGTADNFFDGKLDDIRVYGYALSAGEVTKLYQTTAPTQPVDTGLVGHWTFDGPDIQGTTAIDRSSFGNNGTITGALPAKGKLGQGLSFDGTGDYIAMPGTIANYISVSTATFSVWLKATGSTPTETSVYKGRIVIGDGDTGGYIGISRVNYTSLDRIWFFNDDGSEDSVSVTYNLSEWIHVVGVHSGGTISIYKNGSFAASTASGNTLSVGLPLWVGKGSATGSANWDGQIDEVRVYNRALSATEIANLYNTGR